MGGPKVCQPRRANRMNSVAELTTAPCGKRLKKVSTAERSHSSITIQKINPRVIRSSSLNRKSFYLTFFPLAMAALAEEEPLQQME